MENIDEVPESDVVDEALLDLIEEIAEGEEISEEEFDGVSSLVFDMAEKLVSSEEIKEIPDNDASEEEKLDWVQQSFPKLKEEVIHSLSEEAEIVPEEDDDQDSSI